VRIVADETTDVRDHSTLNVVAVQGVVNPLSSVLVSSPAEAMHKVGTTLTVLEGPGLCPSQNQSQKNALAPKSQAHTHYPNSIPTSLLWRIAGLSVVVA